MPATKHQPQTMTVKDLLEWEDGCMSVRQQDADWLPDQLKGAGVTLDDPNAKVVLSWPDHVTTPRPNGDMSIQLA